MRFVGKVRPDSVAKEDVMARVKEVVIEKEVGDEWMNTKIKHLVPGDTFRMWMYVDDDWKLYESEGQSEFEAKSQPFLHPEHGLWTVSTTEGIFADNDKEE